MTEISTKALKELGTNLFQIALPTEQNAADGWAGAINLRDNLHLLQTSALGNLLLNLKALEETQEAKIHADPPRVLVSSGQAAHLLWVTGRFCCWPIPGDKTTRVERVEVGMSLKVTPPQVYGDEILLAIAPEMSHLVSESRSNLVVKQSSVSTVVKLQDGQTAVLAGMTLQESGEHSKKVPVLGGSIPIIRWLFRSDTTRASEKELLIFVTPVIK